MKTNPPTKPRSSSKGAKSSVTLKDIAAELGISFQAVSQALNPRENTSKVSEATRKRVVATAAKMGYRGNHAARILRSSRSGSMGVLIFDHPHQVMHFRLRHVLSGIHAAGYRPFVHLADTRHDSGATEGCLTMVGASVEGVLLVDPIGFPEESPLPELLDQGIPVVSIGSHQWATVTSYQADRRDGYDQLTRHLIESGCRSITLLREATTERSRQFFHRFHNDMTSGFRNAAAQAGNGEIETRIQAVEFPANWAKTAATIHPIHLCGYLGMRQILSAGKPPDAVLCQADSWAHGALRACSEAGIRVPDDMMLAGFNDEPGSSAGAPPLTTIAQPYAAIANSAIANIIGQIRGEKENAPGKVVTLPGELIVRASTMRGQRGGGTS